MSTQKDPKNVVGRDDLISRIWQWLKRPSQQGSLRFTAERRIGKTTIITKMQAEPDNDFDVLFLEVEGIDSCNGLTEMLVNRMKPLFTKSEAIKSWFGDFWKTAGGTEVGGVFKLPTSNELGWRETLEKALEGFCQNRPDRTVLVILDELPYMLQKIDAVSSKVGRPHEALTLLDSFRALRQRVSNLRMIFAGSVGLHHVLKKMRQATLAAEPVNNMEKIEIPPLEDKYATALALQLLNSEKVPIADGQDLNEVARRIAELTSNVPFYMERIVGRLALSASPIASSDIDQVVLAQLTDDHDPWEMEHFRSRLEIYYQRSLKDTNNVTIEEYALARSILDHLAVAQTPQSIDDVWSFVRSQFALTDRQIAVQMLSDLAQDHYLISDTQKRYSFRFPLIQRWWTIAQGLSI